MKKKMFQTNMPLKAKPQKPRGKQVKAQHLQTLITTKVLRLVDIKGYMSREDIRKTVLDMPLRRVVGTTDVTYLRGAIRISGTTNTYCHEDDLTYGFSLTRGRHTNYALRFKVATYFFATSETRDYNSELEIWLESELNWKG